MSISKKEIIDYLGLYDRLPEAVKTKWARSSGLNPNAYNIQELFFLLLDEKDLYLRSEGLKEYRQLIIDTLDKMPDRVLNGTSYKGMPLLMHVLSRADTRPLVLEYVIAVTSSQGINRVCKTEAGYESALSLSVKKGVSLGYLVQMIRPPLRKCMGSVKLALQVINKGNHSTMCTPQYINDCRSWLEGVKAVYAEEETWWKWFIDKILEPVIDFFAELFPSLITKCYPVTINERFSGISSEGLDEMFRVKDSEVGEFIVVSSPRYDVFIWDRMTKRA